MIPSLLAQQNPAEDNFSGLFDAGKMMIEVGIFAVFIYVVLRFLRATRGSGVIRGLALVVSTFAVAFFILAERLELDRLDWLVEQLAPSVVLGLVVVFHPEIRRAIVHLARLSKERIGALIAIEREASLSELSENGITIDAELNSYLIESIFFPKSALHDGGVVVQDDRIVAASCLFPLSQNPDIDKRLGTRHRAALGLSEETDALIIVVSEETGNISTASNGKLNHGLTLEKLEAALDEVFGRSSSS